MKKYFYLILPVLTFLCAAVYAQPQSVTFFGNYSVALNRFNSAKQYVDQAKKVVSADAPGGGIELKFDIIKNLHLGISAGYKLFSIQQDSALEKWNWKFWETRYKGNVKDALKADTSVTATISVAQKMDVYPVFLVLDFEFLHSPSLVVDAQYGFGVFFFTRRLYLEETWRRYFPQSGYRLEYSYENFAPSRVGNPVASFVGANITYKFSEMFGITGSARYFYVYDTGAEFNFNDFPLKQMVDAKIGLTIFY